VVIYNRFVNDYAQFALLEVIMSKNTPMNLLFAFDGSEHSLAALTFITDLFSNSSDKPKIDLLTVITPRQATDHAIIRETLDRASKHLGENGFKVKSNFILGYPAEQILEYAENAKPELIVVGAKGLRATLGILLGGVAQQVIEYSCCPVLLVRAPYTGMSRCLFVTDGSEFSIKATNYITKFPLPKDADMKVMHVLPPIPIQPSQEYISQYLPIGPDVYPPPPIAPIDEDKVDRQEAEEIEGKTILQTTLDTLKKHGIHAQGMLRHGDAATEIIRYINKEKIELVIAGSRGLSQIRGLLLGSVSRKLVHYAGCSVLIVKDVQRKLNMN
jgi:nucleotide-binding universal stress UspA family protein